MSCYIYINTNRIKIKPRELRNKFKIALNQKEILSTLNKKQSDDIDTLNRTITVQENTINSLKLEIEDMQGIKKIISKNAKDYKDLKNKYWKLWLEEIDKKEKIKRNFNYSILVNVICIVYIAIKIF